MLTPTVAAQRPPDWLVRLLSQPADDATKGHPVFRSQLRRVSLVWVCLSLPVVVFVGSLATTTTSYLVVFALLASGLYTSPALLHTVLAARRAARPDDRCWWLWLAGLVLMYGIGVGMLVGPLVSFRTSTLVNTAVVAVTSLLLMTAIVLVVRSRSGRRAMSVDLTESAMSVIVVVAPAVLVWGDDVLDAEATWYAVPAAVAAVAMVFGTYWAVLLHARLRGDGAGSRMISGVGIALALVGLLNAMGQTVQGISGFALPSGPLLGLHALCMSLLLLMPLFVPSRISPGLDNLPPQDQVRGALLPALLMLVGLPALVATTLLLRDQYEWAPLYSLGVTGVLLVLAAVRQLAAVRETRRLYGQVEQAAAARRELLAQVMQRADDDRHRVAAQLHEQAVSAYASFVSYIQMSSLTPAGAEGSTGVSTLVRDELRDQAESLRQLMLAVQPLEVDRPRCHSLSAPIHAYVDGLYGDHRTPQQTVVVDDDVVLDWTTETVVLRIAQEAVRNVWRHSEATRLDVSIAADEGVVVVEVADNGVGFEPSAVLFESGIAAMRSFALLGQGSLSVDSAPGRGTRVTARLGDEHQPADISPDGRSAEELGRPRLRLLVADRSVDEA
jgi:signal transduction histidine kinase